MERLVTESFSIDITQYEQVCIPDDCPINQIKRRIIPTSRMSFSEVRELCLEQGLEEDRESSGLTPRFVFSVMGVSSMRCTKGIKGDSKYKVCGRADLADPQKFPFPRTFPTGGGSNG